jgi:hypothetical protein
MPSQNFDYNGRRFEKDYQQVAEAKASKKGKGQSRRKSLPRDAQTEGMDRIQLVQERKRKRMNARSVKKQRPLVDAKAKARAIATGSKCQ